MLEFAAAAAAIEHGDAGVVTPMMASVVAR